MIPHLLFLIYCFRKRLQIDLNFSKKMMSDFFELIGELENDDTIPDIVQFIQKVEDSDEMSPEEL